MLKTPIDQHRLAVLIDADNATPTVIGPLLTEVATYGAAIVKRAYGDWTTGRLGGWKELLNEYAIQPIQQFSYTSGKNATDSALIIDAMDLLYTERLTGFCVVSSDSDFTRLATRLRESGMLVFGFGEKKTPPPFVRACDRFIYTEILGNTKQFAPVGENEAAPIPTMKSPKELRSDTKLVHALRTASEASAGEDGWANLSQVRSHLGQQLPDFDPRNYGYRKFLPFIQATDLFDIEDRPGKSGHIFYVVKSRKAKKK